MSAGFHANAIRGEQAYRRTLRKIYKDIVANTHAFHALLLHLILFCCL